MSRAAILAVLAVSVPASGATAAQGDREACMEDESCWTWSTMGNRTRGIMLTSGRSVIVGPCRYRRLASRIDRENTEPRRGDWTALRTGCR